MAKPPALQPHPLWQLRRVIATPLGDFTRPVLWLGNELNIHGPSEAHAVAQANAMGFAGELYAVRVEA